MPPPASRAMPIAEDPAADSPKPTVECIAIVAPRYSGSALNVMPDVERAGVGRNGNRVEEQQRPEQERRRACGQPDQGRNDPGDAHEQNDGAVPAEANGGLVANDAGWHGQDRGDDADRHRLEQGRAAIARRHEGPEGDDPGSQRIKLEAVRAVAQDEAHRRAVAEHRHEVEQAAR